MKILLQTEATKISNRELQNNQQYLIILIDKFFRFPKNILNHKLEKGKK